MDEPQRLPGEYYKSDEMMSLDATIEPAPIACRRRVVVFKRKSAMLSKKKPVSITVSAEECAFRPDSVT